jgi:hypothetical protein
LRGWCCRLYGETSGGQLPLYNNVVVGLFVHGWLKARLRAGGI